MLGKYVVDRPMAGLNEGMGGLSGASEIFQELIGGVFSLEEAKLKAKQNKELIKQQGALERLRQAGQAGGMTMNEGLKWSMMIGIPAVGLLIFALFLKGRK